jgi:hypothetical protein
LPHPKILESKLQCSHVVTFINLLGHILERLNEFGCLLIHMKRYSRALGLRSFRAADCDTDRCLAVAKIRESLAVNKQRSHTFHMERFKQTPWPLVRKRTVPTERPPLVDEI